MKRKVAVTLDASVLRRIDQMVADNIFPNRSQAIELALSEKIERLDRGRLARECAKLDPHEEKDLAEEGIDQELDGWPVY